MMRPLAEQTIVLTGATDGLGRALAGELAAAGATLALHGRDDGRGLATIRDLRERTGNDKLQWFRADLASLEEVRELARRLQSDLDRIDVLVNNAGIGATVPGDGRRLAQIMFTIDLAEELRGSGVTVNSLHPATFMPTKMVVAGGVRPVSTLEEGVAATMRLVAAPELDGVSGRYLNGEVEARPLRQAGDAGARRRLRDLSDQLTGLGAGRER
jgi:NAD(P)-dependent dehydrogenase (short-subunit alcohol dehydrogenase family)